MEILSKLDGKPIAVLHSTDRRSWDGERLRVTESDQTLQIADMNIAKRSFPAHEHKPVDRETTRTVEGWIIMHGEVDVKVYDVDVDRTLLGEWTLVQGDVFVALRGGHAYRVPWQARVVEVKTGPYFGKEADKVVFDENPWGENDAKE